MLRFILGKSGTGKSTETLKIAGELADRNLPVMLIVPDQSTFECEKTLLDVFGAKKAEKVLVFGFSRLCKYVFELTGNSADNVIDEGTRAVAMSLALEELTEKLRLLSSKGNKSLVDVMLQTVSDLKKSSVTSDELRSASMLVCDETLKTKLNETALISDTFDALVSQSYIDPMDDLTRLNDILLNNNVLRDYTIIFDGFSGFTMQQLKVVRSLMRDCTATYFTLTLDPLTDGSEEVFATSQQTYKILKEYAKRDGVDIKAPIKLTDLHRFKNDNLALLEQNIFRPHIEPLEIVPENICVYNAVDMYDECEYVAGKIKHLVIEKGYLYSDISVICHDTEPYRGVLSEILEKYEIPYFSDEHADIDVKPVIRFVNSIFRCLIYDFDREDVLALLKSGLTEFSVEEISLFENYLFVWNVSGSAFKNKFVQNPKGYFDRFSDYDREVLISCVRRIQDTYNVQVYLEPGEAVALNAGHLITTVEDIVHNDIAVLDVSAACHMPDVIEMPYRPPLFDSGEAKEKEYTYLLGGPTCLAGDVIGSYSFDQPLKVGDRLTFGDMAIYTTVKNNTFNGMRLPAIVLEDKDGECRVVRQFVYEDFKMRL